MKRKTIAGQEQETNVELVISNQSFDTDPVDIEILVDGKQILNEKFHVDGDQPAQHNWKRHRISLVDGPHILTVSSKKGQAKMEKKLQVIKSLTVTIAYWDTGQPNDKISKGFFTIDSGENKVATM